MRYKTSLKHTNFLIDLTPLVDVIFLMLIFFLITSDVLPLKSLHIENPKLAHNSSPLTTQLLVVMDASQVIYLGSHKDIVDFESLKGFLKDELDALKRRHPEAQPTIVLSVDRRVDYGAFLRLFSIAQQCDAPLRLVYKPEEEQG